MSFIQSKATLAASAILTDIRKLRASYLLSVDHLNSVVRNFLSLPDADLAEFGNMMDPQEMQQLLGLHAQLGDGTNKSLVAVETLLATLERRAPNIPKQVDVRPLSDKLAGQKREMLPDKTGKWTIRPIAYPPELTVSTTWGAVIGYPFEIVLDATENPESFNITDLPQWLTQDGKILRGIPDTEGEFTFTVAAIGLRGATNGPVKFSITVTVAQPEPEPQPEP